MSYYSTCPDCGAHLDPCEVCNCHMEIDGVKYSVTGFAHHERLGAYTCGGYAHNE